MHYDLVIDNCRIVTPESIFPGRIAISGGKIASVGRVAEGVIHQKLDAGGKFILPGVIDTHVHLGTTEQHFSEAVSTESTAAVAGGVTTLLVYKQIPVLNKFKDLFKSVLEPDMRAIEENSLVDIGFHGLILDDDSLDRIDEIVDEMGITSFKFIMAYRGEEAMPHF
jgi:dihydroorotase-like cyclic amidohydrolase